MSGFDWLVAGLGNPGPEYENTPHNLGFLAIDRLAARNGIKVSRKDCMALVGQGMIAEQKALFAKPQTFMNVCGPSVNGLMVKGEVRRQRLLVIYDDLDIPWQAVRIRPGGSAGGHHGLESVIKSVGGNDFPRVRLGIHGGSRERDGARIVLGQFSRSQRVELEELLDYTSQAVESILAEGVEKSMTRFNRRAQGLNNEEE